jgi:hypothetical protein
MCSRQKYAAGTKSLMLRKENDMFRKTSLLLLLISLLSAGCLPVGTIDVGVEPTREPTPLPPTQTLEPTEEPTPLLTAKPEAAQGPGFAAGKVCFPSEFIPEMTAFFRSKETGELFELPIGLNQTTYEVELPMGEYTAFAYPLDSADFGGSYSAAVTCGLEAACSDHSLLTFSVLPGETTAGVDLCDWYAPESVPPNPKASQPADAALAGLVYRSSVSYDLWQVEADGQARLLADLYDVDLSLDGSRALYAEEGDIWMQDLATGIATNLTNTPDREESGPQWWPANPDLVVFHSFPYEEERGLASGQVTFMGLDGSGYTVIDDGRSYFGPALHPDGHTIAYDNNGGWLYHMEDGSREPFIPHMYGLEAVERVTSPTWSPDGTKLAWWVHGDFGIGPQVALGVFDFRGGGHSLLHPYTPVSMEGGNPTPLWSPDGQYLASTVIGDQVRGSLWVFRVDGIEEINLGNAANAVWSPDSRAMAYTRWPGSGPAQEATVEVVEIGAWEILETPLLLGSIPTEWLILQ